MIDMYSEEVRQEPFPAYAEIRRLGSAVYNRSQKVWHVGRYDDAVEVLGNDELFSSEIRGFESTLIYADGAAHDRVRKLILPAFLASRIQVFDRRIQALADSLVSQFEKQGEFDFVEDLAVKIPANVVAWMLGIGAERTEEFRRWTTAIVDAGHKRLIPPGKKAGLRNSCAFGTNSPASKGKLKLWQQ